MSSIGHKQLNKCTHPGCTKTRPYWSMHCKQHRAPKTVAPITSPPAKAE